MPGGTQGSLLCSVYRPQIYSQMRIYLKVNLMLKGGNVVAQAHSRSTVRTPRVRMVNPGNSVLASHAPWGPHTSSFAVIQPLNLN